MKMHLPISEAVLKNGKVMIITSSKKESSCGRRESGFRATGGKSNRGQSGSVIIATSYLTFSEYDNRCSHCTAKYNELILKARSLK
jgi:hypothetical protein